MLVGSQRGAESDLANQESSKGPRPFCKANPHRLGHPLPARYFFFQAIGYTAVTDAGVKELAALTRLEELTFRGPRCRTSPCAT
jgi:hypothetical protein